MRSADIFVGLKAAWDANGTLTGLVTGGLHEGRPSEVTLPYAVMAIEEEDWQLTSGLVSLQGFIIRIWVWSVTGVPNAGLIQQALEAAFRQDRKDDIVVRAARVLHITPMAGDLNVDAARNEARDVLLGKAAWHLMLQLNR